ncbi:MAG: MBL fold metallo-hydrolase [Cyclobacteriaceae bacterium]|nr:MBL fold metallo-hydrolase [Cytophagales bacterium]MBX2899723.1 MBL fold metallo-hydrolase [Cyclobacteriaceae bacterium]
MLTLASLNSGSNGNCYYVGTSQEAVLIDAGISCRETERRLKRLGLSIEAVKAIFITHEHNDHISGLHKLIKRHAIPVYVSLGTRQNGSLVWSLKLSHSFAAYQPVAIGGLTITALPKYHDAADPHSFLISHQQTTVGVFTDMGRVCKHLIDAFKQCHAAILESNYDEEMLERGTYPQHLKNRIRGGWGHISNKQALQLFMEHRPEQMSHLLLGHLSQHNNKPEIVETMFNAVAGNTQIIIASRYRETEAFPINSVKAKPREVVEQLQLF